MDYHFVVVKAFGDFSRGDVITDPDLIVDHEHEVVRTYAPHPHVAEASAN